MLASRATMERLANGVPVYMGAGPRDREACLHFFPEGEGLLVYAWLDGAAWGVPAVQYHILGEVITGPFSLLPTSKA
jgi:hypothetical protein